MRPQTKKHSSLSKASGQRGTTLPLKDKQQETERHNAATERQTTGDREAQRCHRKTNNRRQRGTTLPQKDKQQETERHNAATERQTTGDREAQRCHRKTNNRRQRGTTLPQKDKQQEAEGASCLPSTFSPSHHLSKVHVHPSPVQSTCTAIACPKYMYSYRLTKVHVQPSPVQSTCTAIACPKYMYSHRLTKVHVQPSPVQVHVQPLPVQSICTAIPHPKYSSSVHQQSDSVYNQTVSIVIACPKYTSSVQQLSDCMYSHHLPKKYQFCTSTIRFYTATNRHERDDLQLSRGLVCKKSAIYTIIYKTTSRRVNYFLQW